MWPKRVWNAPLEIPTQNCVASAVSQAKMAPGLPKALGAIFSLSGAAVIIMARERLSLAKSARTMASYIQKAKEDLGEDLREDIPKNSWCI